MILHFKWGTHCQRRMHVVRKRVPPKVGDCFKVKELHANGKPYRWDKPIGVYLHEIRDVGGYQLYVVELM